MPARRRSSIFWRRIFSSEVYSDIQQPKEQRYGERNGKNPTRSSNEERNGTRMTRIRRMGAEELRAERRATKVATTGRCAESLLRRVTRARVRTGEEDEKSPARPALRRTCAGPHYPIPFT